MFRFRILFVLLLFFAKLSSPTIKSEQQHELQLAFQSATEVLNFMDSNYEEINFDGVLGVVLAEAQLKIASNLQNIHQTTRNFLEYLIAKCQSIKEKIFPILPTKPDYMFYFKKFLLNVSRWTSSENKEFISDTLPNLGIYQNWTVASIRQNRKAVYKGVETDKCFREIIEFSKYGKQCHVSPICNEMMLDRHRIDSGYLLTHRLLYFKLVNLRRCTIANVWNNSDYIKLFCSLIYKETKTNAQLGFAYHDIFLEQVVFCGSEGYTEFLNQKWFDQIQDWQKPFGCYESFGDIDNKTFARRSSNTISYGCSDHSTGLGSAAIALYTRFLLTN